MAGTFGSPWAQPRLGLKPEDCFFYHVIDLPGVGTVGEHWDLRPNIDDYLGGLDYAGKTVFDVGTAGGFLTFELEKRGGLVTSFDRLTFSEVEMVRFWNDQESSEETAHRKRVLTERVKNGYWFAHERLGSRARVYYGNIFDLPPLLGQYDVVVLGQVLPHVRDVLGALESCARLSRDMVVMTQHTLPDERPITVLRPGPESDETRKLRHVWWAVSDGCLERFMSILGFELTKKSRGRYVCLAFGPAQRLELTTLVFRRMSH